MKTPKPKYKIGDVVVYSDSQYIVKQACIAAVGKYWEYLIEGGTVIYDIEDIDGLIEEEIHEYVFRVKESEIEYNL